MIHASNGLARCGIVLAGGEGRRVEPFIRRLLGKALPKQYVNFTGERSMLEQTFRRVERLIPASRLFTVASEKHLDYPEVKRQLSGRPPETLVMQPENKETGPGILLPLMHVFKRYPEASVAIFPSDHFIAEEDLFMAYVDMALRKVESCPSSVALIGVEPTHLESDYGYILPGRGLDHQGPWGMRKVVGFVEKPAAGLVREIILQKGLWNTFVMAFKARTMLKLARQAWPVLYDIFRQIRKAIGTPAEREIVREAYRNMEAVNFSKGLLESLPLGRDAALWVLPLSGVRWSDWGSEERILSSLREARRAADFGTPRAQEQSHRHAAGSQEI